MNSVDFWLAKELAQTVKAKRNKQRRVKMSLDKYLDVKFEFELDSVVEPLLRAWHYQGRFALSEDDALQWTRNYYQHCRGLEDGI